MECEECNESDFWSDIIWDTDRLVLILECINCKTRYSVEIPNKNLENIGKMEIC